jgi:peptidoglycan/LPS O-acetylase OafA/YrhL
MSIRQIPSLDGLRAVSVLLVMLAHMGLKEAVPGGFGVTVFFFLSGFLITTLMRTEFDGSGSVSLRNFWLRRALRILPPFYLVLFVTTAAALVFDPPGTVTLPGVASQVLHFTNYWIIWNGYDGQAPGTGVFWSLAVEEHFYVLFPWLFLALRRAQLTGRNQAMVLWGLCVAILLWRLALVGIFDAPEARTYHATDTRVDAILFGCALAVWHNPVLDPGTYPERLWKYGLFPAALAVLLACLLYRSPFFRETFRYSLQGAALTFVFITAIRFHDWLPFRVLNLRPVAFLGVLSYSLYLVHYPLIFAVERWVPEWPAVTQGLLAAALSLAAAWAIHVTIEKPCARLRKTLSAPARAPAAAKSGAPNAHSHAKLAHEDPQGPPAPH